ncbi:peptidyl-prolyl cis-trans isomerase [Neobacillus sp. LXY-1]|uniref:peptidyl-prolyl cis-trans isomerase n=1 Tax=Neobacillus sp. LXY-1 TaxID=3379133 RepID=UPI003EE003BD
MGKKQLWMVIAGLILLNCLTITFFLTKGSNEESAENEAVAKVGKQTITRQDWLHQLEIRYGKDVLKEMIDQKVIKEMAEKYGIRISDQEVEREFRLLQATNQSFNQNNTYNNKKWKEQIRNSLILEELLTKDVNISDKELRAYYEKNKDLFNVPEVYHLSQIIVKTNDEAKKVLKELSQGSSFSATAMESSVDEFSANEGGDIGYISEGDEKYPDQYITAAKQLKKGAVTKPIKVEQGYAVLKLMSKKSGLKYSYNQVKDEIRRQMALEQLKTSASASTFWKEAGVEWFYGKDQNTN